MLEAVELSFADITVGQRASFVVKLNRQRVTTFLNLSGDFNPLHADENYARSTPFGQRVVPGLLLASYFSRLIGMHLPGKRSLYISQTISFHQPAFIDDEIRVSGEVMRLSRPTKLISLQTRVERVGDGKLLVDGEARVLCRE